MERRYPHMQMDSGGMSSSEMESMMDSDNMNVGTIDVFHFPVLYWSIVAAVIAAAALVNVFYYLIFWQRMTDAKRGRPTPAKPKFAPIRWCATFTAIVREIIYASLPMFSFRGYVVRQPTLGGVLLISANAVLLIVLSFYRIDASDLWQFENIGYRIGFLSICQLPLVFLLSSKTSVIGWLTGMSYEKLNWIHRWVARTLLLTCTMHGAYFIADWAPFNFVTHMMTTDQVTQRGVAAWAILVWIALSSIGPIRGLSYEFFVVQHIISMIAFVVVVYLHTPDEVHMWIWFTVAVYLFDRVMRTLLVVYNNASFLHSRKEISGKSSSILACRAELSPLPCDVTRVTIRNPPISWKAGQHVLLSCHSVVPLQSHPFTAYSLPSEGKMEFLIKAKSGGTRRFLNYAEKHFGLPSLQNQSGTQTSMAVTIDGPYGRIRPLRQFDSVVLLAGSTGATFTLPLMREIVQRWQQKPSGQRSLLTRFIVPDGAVTRRVRFVWVVKSRDQIGWFSSHLSQAVEDVEALHAAGQDVELDISIYVTCDEAFTTEINSTTSSASAPTTKITTYDDAESRISSSNDLDSEKGQLKVDFANAVGVKEIDPRSALSETQSRSGGCQPDGTCCCTATIEDESAEGSSPVICSCNCGTDTLAKEARGKRESGSSVASARSLQLHPRIKILSGRPQTRNIIGRSLERALGESAVVVCGPNGLVNDVRRSNVALSDGRAVHKGSGAQGVYLHTEAFCY